MVFLSALAAQHQLKHGTDNIHILQWYAVAEFAGDQTKSRNYIRGTMPRYMFFKTCKDTAKATAVSAAAMIEFAGQLLAAHCRHQHRA